MADEPQSKPDEKDEDAKADEALEGRVAGESPPPETVKVLTPEEAAKYRSHPKAKPPGEGPAAK